MARTLKTREAVRWNSPNGNIGALLLKTALSALSF
jgi:hypothetical protein